MYNIIKKTVIYICIGICGHICNMKTEKKRGFVYVKKISDVYLKIEDLYSIISYNKIICL